eukprot:6194839-Pleurochrysis_carterae.AAC.6
MPRSRSVSEALTAAAAMSRTKPEPTSCCISCRLLASISRIVLLLTKHASTKARSASFPALLASRHASYAAATVSRSDCVLPNASIRARDASSCLCFGVKNAGREVESAAATVRSGGKQPQRHPSSSILPSLGSRGNDPKW